MSENNAFGFVKFVPGFDFLQNLAKGAAGTMPQIPQLPQLSHWVAPTINVEELEKRITELKSVQFWLEQNSRALAATVQALEVQKMTLATLQGMNFNMGDLANAFKLNADAVVSGVQKVSETAASVASAAVGDKTDKADKADRADRAEKSTSDASLIDPLQWWGALTSQFQQIASTALKDVARQSAADSTNNAATDFATEAFKTATEMATQFAAKGVQTMQDAAAGMKASASASASSAPESEPESQPQTAAKKPAAKRASKTAATAPVAKKTTPRRSSGQ